MSRKGVSALQKRLCIDEDNLIAVCENAVDHILTKDFQRYVKDRKFSIFVAKQTLSPKGKLKML